MTALENMYRKYFTTAAFWAKVQAVLGKISEGVLIRALALFYALQDEDTPKWAKGVIVGALGYFIFPLDVMPDFAPMVGYVDDASVLAAAVYTVLTHVKELHMMKARAMLDAWLGRNREAIEVWPRKNTKGTKMKRCEKRVLGAGSGAGTLCVLCDLLWIY